MADAAVQSRQSARAWLFNSPACISPSASPRTYCAFTTSPCWKSVFAAFEATFGANGLTPFFGRPLPALFRATGLREILVKIHHRLHGQRDYHRSLLLPLVTSARGHIVEHGLFTEAELFELEQALRLHLDDPETLVSSQLLFQVWGRRPEPNSCDS